MSDKPAPVDCQRMIVIREDLSGFVRAGDHVIEFQLAARAAADIAADLMRFILKRHPHLGWPLAEQMWQTAIAQLTDDKLAAVVGRQAGEAPQPEVIPTGVPPYAH